MPLRVPHPKKGPPPPPLKPGRQSESAYSHSSNTTLINNSNNNSSSRINSNIYASSTSLAAPQHRLNSPHDSLRSNHSDNNLTLLSSSPKSTYSRAHQQYDNTEYPSNRNTFKGVFSNLVSSMSGTKKSELTFLFPIPQLEHCFFLVVVHWHVLTCSEPWLSWIQLLCISPSFGILITPSSLFQWYRPAIFGQKD